MRKGIFDHIQPGEELVREPFQRLIDKQALLAYHCPGFWQCMDTYRDWERLEEHWKSGHAPWISDPTGLHGRSSWRSEP